MLPPSGSDNSDSDSEDDGVELNYNPNRPSHGAFKKSHEEDSEDEEEEEEEDDSERGIISSFVVLRTN